MNTRWRNALIRSSATLYDAIKLLESEALIGIALVVDSEDKLIGTVTDGDVRRALIEGCPMDAPVTQVLNAEPVLGKQNDEVDKLNRIASMGNVTRIPIIDHDGHVCGLRFVDESISGGTEPRVVIMAGGFGTRLRPITEQIPKPLVRVGGKPILERLIEQLRGQGLCRVTIALFYKAEMIREYFGDGEKWGVDISYVFEEEPLGTAGALGLLSRELPGQPILVLNCDLLTKVNFSQLLDFHAEERSNATVGVRQYDIQVPYGVIRTEGKAVRSIDEKPTQSHFINAGIYVFDSQFLSLLSPGEKIDMPDLIRLGIDKDRKVTVFPIHEYWLDIGALPELSAARSELKDNSSDWL